MSGVLALVDDFIERMSNPAYGLSVNEEYAQRLSDAFAREGDRALLMAEVRRLEGVGALSMATWAWILTLPESQSAVAQGTMLELAHRFSRAEFLVGWLKSVLEDDAEASLEDIPGLDESLLSDIESPLIADLIRATVLVEPDPDPDPRLRDSPESLPSQLEDAQQILLALLLVDSRDCLVAAAALLNHEWAGHDGLNAYFRGRLATMDAESRRDWSRLTRDQA